MSVDDFDWKSIGRWSLLGVLVMAVWILWPAMRCSWKVYNGTPLVQLDDSQPQGTVDPVSNRDDVVVVRRDMSFVDKLKLSMVACYDASPVSAQEMWKKTLFWVFLALTIIARFLHARWLRSRHTSL